MFAIGGVGYGGQTTPGEVTLDYLLQQKDPEQYFLSLITGADSPGKLYALYGLKRCKSPAYKSAAHSLFLITTEISTMQGCIGRWRPLGEVAREIAAGYYDN
jgi:hypothetical protein